MTPDAFRDTSQVVSDSDNSVKRLYRQGSVSRAWGVRYARCLVPEPVVGRGVWGGQALQQVVHKGLRDEGGAALGRLKGAPQLADGRLAWPAATPRTSVLSLEL